jgi:hypothetical protein
MGSGKLDPEVAGKLKKEIIKYSEAIIEIKREINDLQNRLKQSRVLKFVFKFFFPIIPHKNSLYWPHMQKS